MEIDNLENITFSVTYRGVKRLVSTNEKVIKIGRDQKAKLCLSEDPTVARLHAIIEVTNNEQGKPEIWLLDLGSTTYLNGVSIDKAKVNIGNAIKVGETTIKINSVSFIRKEQAESKQQVELPEFLMMKVVHFIAPASRWLIKALTKISDMDKR